jgi:hypothetical protein
MSWVGFLGMRYLGLAGFLFAFWLALSGHYTPMLVAAGAASSADPLLYE